jgi:hypothetical protein
VGCVHTEATVLHSTDARLSAVDSKLTDSRAGLGPESELGRLLKHTHLPPAMPGIPLWVPSQSSISQRLAFVPRSSKLYLKVPAQVSQNDIPMPSNTKEHGMQASISTAAFVDTILHSQVLSVDAAMISPCPVSREVLQRACDDASQVKKAALEQAYWAQQSSLLSHAGENLHVSLWDLAGQTVFYVMLTMLLSKYVTA